MAMVLFSPYQAKDGKVVNLLRKFRLKSKFNNALKAAGIESAIIFPRIFPGNGIWKGSYEPSYLSIIFGESEAKILKFAEALKQSLHQDSVLVVFQNNNDRFVFV